MLEDRVDPKKPALRPVTVGTVLTRFGCRVLVRMNRLTVAAQLLLSHQFSFGVNGGVQQVILGCKVALQVHPSFVQSDFDLANAHTFSSRDKAEEELESDIIYHYMLESFRALYGKNATPQWHYGNGPDRPPTSCHMSVEGFRQGDAPATVYFNILVARVYRRLLAVLDGRGVLFAIADDVKTAAPPDVTGEIVAVFADIAWKEAGLKTQPKKNRIYVQPSAQDDWAYYLETTPRTTDPEVLCIHDIPDGSFLEVEGDTDSRRIWPSDDGINILGTPLGSPEFIESYLFGKGIKHRQLLSFIQDFAAAGFPREVVAMLTGAASQRLTHLLKSIKKNPQTALWMQEMDTAHVSTWLHCLTASTDLENALDFPSRESLTGLLDLPPSYGGIGLQSLERAADEEFMGSFASISAALISFCRRTGLPVYISIAEAIERMGDTAEMLEVQDIDPSPMVHTILEVSEVAERTPMEIPTDDQLILATELVRGHSVVEVPGRWNKTGDRAPDPITLPDPRPLTDYVLAPCKNECGIIKQARYVRQAHHIFTSLDPVRKALMRASAGQCGRDSAHCSRATVEAVARMDCPASMAHSELSEGVLFSAATLNRFGLPYDYANLESCILPESCPCCSAPLWVPGQHLSRVDRIFV